MKYLLIGIFMISILALTACQENDTGMQLEGEDVCNAYNGTWLPEFHECEFMSEEACYNSLGQFSECESACRHDPDAEICTMQCVPVCTYGRVQF